MPTAQGAQTQQTPQRTWHLCSSSLSLNSKVASVEGHATKKKIQQQDQRYYWGWCFFFGGGRFKTIEKNTLFGVHRENPQKKSKKYMVENWWEKKQCERSRVLGDISHFSKKGELYLELSPQVEKLLLVVANFRNAHWIPSSSSLPPPSSSIMSNTM